MTPAAFFFYLMAVFAFFTIAAGLGDLLAHTIKRRKRRQYREWLRARRAHLDSLEPQRWDDRQAHPWERAS